jgi:hypothetical protein
MGGEWYMGMVTGNDDNRMKRLILKIIWYV